MGGARRYAQCHFVDMSDLKRFMLEQVRYIFCNFTRQMQIGAGMKSLKNIWKVNREFNPEKNQENQKIIDNWERRIKQVLNYNKNE